jgi:hypothetical protein
MRDKIVENINALLEIQGIDIAKALGNNNLCNLLIECRDEIENQKSWNAALMQVLQETTNKWADSEDRIERLEAALRDALIFVEYRSYAWDCESNTTHPTIIVENARAALGEKKDETEK